MHPLSRLRGVRRRRGSGPRRSCAAIERSKGGAVKCENEGSVVGNKPCPNEATHRVQITYDADDYETHLCPSCFAGFRAEMIESGHKPKNEALPTGGADK